MIVCRVLGVYLYTESIPKAKIYNRASKKKNKNEYEQRPKWQRIRKTKFFRLDETESTTHQTHKHTHTRTRALTTAQNKFALQSAINAMLSMRSRNLFAKLAKLLSTIKILIRNSIRGTQSHTRTHSVLRQNIHTHEENVFYQLTSVDVWCLHMKVSQIYLTFGSVRYATPDNDELLLLFIAIVCCII